MRSSLVIVNLDLHKIFRDAFGMLCAEFRREINGVRRSKLKPIEWGNVAGFISNRCQPKSNKFSCENKCAFTLKTVNASSTLRNDHCSPSIHGCVATMPLRLHCNRFGIRLKFVACDILATQIHACPHLNWQK